MSDANETSFPQGTQPVVVAHDLGPGGRRAADLGAVFARALGAPLLLIHAMDTAADADLGAVPAGLTPAVEILRARIAARVAAERAALDAEVARLRSAGCANVVSEHVEGRPAEALVDAARHARAQLLAVAAHSGEPTASAPAHGVARLLGSTAERVVRHAGMSVVVAPDAPAPAGLCAGAPWLVGIDLGETSRPPLEAAQRLSARFGGRIVAVHAAKPGDPDRALELAHFVGAGGDAATLTLEGEAAEVFARAAASEGCAAVLLGVHEHRGLLAKALGRDALGPTFRTTQLPVICVPG
jgi:nucleotide-binding universal stress UspA family protein